jgi:hypothetical protein
MNRLLVGVLALALGAVTATAQSLDDLNIQIHGYATQGFLYTTNNNILTTQSSAGSPDWTDAVVNLTAQPIPKLRVGVQARYFLLGNYSNQFLIDWAAADYKVNEKFGVRFGKVKTPATLYNEILDIDPGYIWSLMPQSVYPISSRESFLAHYGGVTYGKLNLGKSAGKLDYWAWAGERVIASNDGFLVPSAEKGIVAPNGVNGWMGGGNLAWELPIRGLKAGASYAYQAPRSGVINYTTKGLTYTGTMIRSQIKQPDYYGQYERGKVLAAFEYQRKATYYELDTITGGATPFPTLAEIRTDPHMWFAMATYKVTGKLTAGAYDSQWINRSAALTSSGARFSKDWDISARYDINEFLYVKAEEHFIHGTGVVYDTNLNLSGLKPTTKLTLFKVGVSF